MGFESMPQFDKTKKDLSETEESEEQPASQEQNPELKEINPEKQEIMESFQEKRGGILTNFLTSEMISNGLNLVPFAGGGKMLIESFHGGTLGGEKLAGKDRLVHAGIAAASLGIDFTMLGAAGKGTILVGRSLPLIEKIGSQLVARGSLKSARIFAATSRFMAEHPKLVEEAEKAAEIQLNLAVERIKEYQKTKV